MKAGSPKNSAEDEVPHIVTEAETTEENFLDVTVLQAQLEAEKERTLQLAADFENFRRRTARDEEDRAAAQKLAFIRELLPVVDNFERALTADTTTTAKQFRRGIEMTLQQVFQVLGQHGIEPDDCRGKPFDPNRHEAIGARFERGRPDQTVLEVVQRGYRQGSAVIRPARVIINDHSLTERRGEETT